MFTLRLFDIDKSLEIDSSTKDFKTVYNEEAVNQSIDVFLTNPYRIGRGLTNSLFTSVFADIGIKKEIDIQRDIEIEMERNYPFISVRYIDVTSIPEQRKIKVFLRWSLKGTEVTGDYTRYWEQRT